ncbi:MAG TPA: DUF5989 family protein [Candidatus Paceibacterota bacterium]
MEPINNSKFSTIKQIWGFIKTNKKWWLLPLFLIIVSAGLLLVFAQTSVFAPFIYTLF